jgi:hypothetical protein
MTFKKLKIKHGKHVGNDDYSEAYRLLTEAWRGRAFWSGVVDGFAPHKFLLADCKYRSLLGKDDSVYQAWIDVGKLLTDSMGEYHHVETAQDREPAGQARQPVERVSRRSKEFAGHH